MLSDKKRNHFLQKNSQLFWWMKPEDVLNLGTDSVVETILNYGDEDDVKKMFDIYGLENVSQSFFKNIDRKRENYLPLTKHFFKLYFNRHAPKHSY